MKNRTWFIVQNAAICLLPVAFFAWNWGALHQDEYQSYLIKPLQWWYGLWAILLLVMLALSIFDIPLFEEGVSYPACVFIGWLGVTVTVALLNISNHHEEDNSHYLYYTKTTGLSETIPTIEIPPIIGPVFSHAYSAEYQMPYEYQDSSGVLLVGSVSFRVTSTSDILDCIAWRNRDLPSDSLSAGLKKIGGRVHSNGDVQSAVDSALKEYPFLIRTQRLE